MRTHRVKGLFNNFEEAFAAVSDLRHSKVPGISIDNVTLIHRLSIQRSKKS